jgi:hypothetical protein
MDDEAVDVREQQLRWTDDTRDEFETSLLGASAAHYTFKYRFLQLLAAVDDAASLIQIFRAAMTRRKIATMYFEEGWVLERPYDYLRPLPPGDLQESCDKIARVLGSLQSLKKLYFGKRFLNGFGASIIAGCSQVEYLGIIECHETSSDENLARFAAGLHQHPLLEVVILENFCTREGADAIQACQV